MLNFITHSLKIKFSLLAVSVLLIIFTLASYVVISQTTNLQKESLIARAETFADLATQPLGDAYNLYADSGELRLNNIFRKTLALNDTVPRIQLISVNGDVLFDTNDMQNSGPGSDNLKQVRIVNPQLLQAIEGNTNTNIYDDHGNITEIVVPYSDDYGDRPYSLRYFISYDSINTAINHVIWTTMVLIVILFCFTFASLMLLVNKSILSPLEKLAMFAASIGHGDFDYPLSIETGDELEKLATTYLNMARILKDDRAAIVTEKDTLSLVLSNIADGVIALDFSCKVMVFNQAASQILGLKTDIAIGKDLDNLLTFHEVDKTVMIKDLCMQSENKVSFHSLNFTMHDNQIKKINAIIAPLAHPTLTNITFIITFYDLTKEEEFEKMKLDFVSMAAHELRTPLTSIRGYLSLLQQSIAPRLTSAESTYLQRSIVSSEQLYFLIQNLLNISNIEHGKMDIRLVPVNLEKTITSIITDLKAQAEENNVQLTFDKPEQPVPSAFADDFRITEVITNLITNAINYNRPGGWVKVTMQQKDANVVISVRDNGMGIIESALPHLFTKFYRVTTPLRMGSKGTGLGLFISKKIIDAHQGKIWVESQPDKETIFSFSLPLAEKKN
jgi:PAS domain S-box-containing protein